jgi:hypothetical protein
VAEPKGTTMTATAISVPVAGPSRASTLRLALFVLAVVALVAVAFVLGHLTGQTVHHVSVIAPPATHTTATVCRMGRPC